MYVFRESVFKFSHSCSIYKCHVRFPCNKEAVEKAITALDNPHFTKYIQGARIGAECLVPASFVCPILSDQQPPEWQRQLGYRKKYFDLVDLQVQDRNLGSGFRDGVAEVATHIRRFMVVCRNRLEYLEIQGIWGNDTPAYWQSAAINLALDNIIGNLLSSLDFPLLSKIRFDVQKPAYCSSVWQLYEYQSGSISPPASFLGTNMARWSDVTLRNTILRHQDLLSLPNDSTAISNFVEFTTHLQNIRALSINLCFAGRQVPLISHIFLKWRSLKSPPITTAKIEGRLSTALQKLEYLRSLELQYVDLDDDEDNGDYDNWDKVFYACIDLPVLGCISFHDLSYLNSFAQECNDTRDCFVPEDQVDCAAACALLNAMGEKYVQGKGSKCQAIIHIGGFDDG